MKRLHFLSPFVSGLTLISLFFTACNPSATNHADSQEQQKQDSIELAKKEEQKAIEEEKKRPRKAEDIQIEKKFQFEEYTLEDTYEYQDTTREFQWDKIKERVAYIENFQREPKKYAVIQNYRNMNRESPVVKNFVRNEYGLVSDTLGVERYQSAPLYVKGETDEPTIYGRDGSLVELLSSDTIDMVTVKGISFEGEWDIPKRYVKALSDSTTFHQIVVVDVKNQNIATLERDSYTKWNVLSMNPSTTGKYNPPYGHDTPVGLFVIQEQKPKMFYYKDGTKDIGGFAPWASRFTNGAYLHGVPVNKPRNSIIEWSASLGTTPRSHMCVRNASSHAKFIYDWVKIKESLVVVID